MKNLFLLFIFFFFALSCGEEKQPEPQENSIYGNWQLTKRFHVLPSSVELIENGEKITFRENGEFYSASFPCKGLFEKKGDSLVEVSFQCRDKISFLYTYLNQNPVIKRSFGFEGGYDEYKKISLEQ
jgi:hypothetical protein